MQPCRPKRDSWSYRTKACESQLSSDGFEMWALLYHLPARCWERRHIHNSHCLIRQFSLSLSFSLSLCLPFSGGRDVRFQLCATKTKLGTWQFQYGPFFCIKLIGCGFDHEVEWFVCIAGLWMCCDTNNAFQFQNNKGGRGLLTITPRVANILQKNERQQWTKMLREIEKFCSYQKSKHCCAHSIKASHTKAQQQAAIDPSAAVWRADWDSTLIDHFTINSSWLLVGETSRWPSAAAIAPSVSLADHSEHEICKCNQLLFSHCLSITTHTQNQDA